MWHRLTFFCLSSRCVCPYTITSKIRIRDANDFPQLHAADSGLDAWGQHLRHATGEGRVIGGFIKDESGSITEAECWLPLPLFLYWPPFPCTGICVQQVVPKVSWSKLHFFWQYHFPFPFLLFSFLFYFYFWVKPVRRRVEGLCSNLCVLLCMPFEDMGDSQASVWSWRLRP